MARIWVVLMSDKNPCPFCGDDSEYSRFINLCAERANEKWRENEVKIITNLYKSMDFIQVVRCRDCKYLETQTVSFSDKPLFVCIAEWCIGAEGDNPLVEPDGFCAWGERAWVTCKCGEELESFGRVRTCPSCGRRLMA